MKKEHFKIQRADGLFSGGGICPRFDKNGKTWTELRHVIAHLKQLHNGHGIPGRPNVRPTSVHGCTVFKHIYENSEVITYISVETHVFPVDDLLKSLTF